MIKYPKFLRTLMLSLVMMIAFAPNCFAQPQTINIDRDQFIKALTKAQQAKLYEQEIAQYKVDTALLSYRIAELRATIEELKENSLNNEKVIVTYQNQILVMQEQRKLLESQIDNLTKLAKKFKRKMLWRSIEGIGLAIAAFFLGLKL